MGWARCTLGPQIGFLVLRCPGVRVEREQFWKGRDLPAKCTNPLPSFNHHSHQGAHGSLGPFTAQHPPSVAGGASPGEDVVRREEPGSQEMRAVALIELLPAAWSCAERSGLRPPPSPQPLQGSRSTPPPLNPRPVRRPCSDRRSGFRGAGRSVDSSPRGRTLPLSSAPSRASDITSILHPFYQYS